LIRLLSREVIVMAKTKRVHCNKYHVDAYLIEYDDGRLVIRCVRRQYCSECPFEKGITPKRIRI